MAPIASAATTPPHDRDGRDDDLPVLGRRVDRGHGGAEPDTDHAAGSGEHDCLGQELPSDVGLGCAERAAQPDLASPFDHCDHHHVGDADPADEQRDRSETEEQ